MSDEPRLSAQTLKVLQALLISAADELSGAEIGKAAKLASGTLYPILMRLEQAKWLQSRWEKGDPAKLGRPRRRYYRVTALGAKKASAAASELEPMVRRFAWEV